MTSRSTRDRQRPVDVCADPQPLDVVVAKAEGGMA